MTLPSGQITFLLELECESPPIYSLQSIALLDKFIWDSEILNLNSEYD
jgi:hypothetical protein